MYICLLILLLFFLLFCSAFFSASEVAFFSLSSLKIAYFKQSQEPKKRQVALLFDAPRDLLITILVLDVSVNIIIQNLVASLFFDFDSYLLTVGVPLFLVLLFGDFLPKAVAIRHNQRIAVAVAPLFHWLQRCIAPIRILLNWASSSFGHLFSFFLPKEKELSLQQLKEAIRGSKESALLDEEEVRWIDGYLDLHQFIVKELMRKRHEIIAFDLHAPLEELYQMMVEEQHSEIPVYEDEFDHLVGVITAEDLFVHRDEINSSVEVKQYVKKPFFVPEGMVAKHLIEEFQKRAERLAIVVNEHGSWSGLITLEDLTRFFLRSSHDKRKETTPQSMNEVMVISGQTELQEVEEKLKVQLPSPSNCVTIGGWLTEQAGDLLQSGDRFTYDSLLFHVLSADEKKITRMYIRHLPNFEEDE